MKKLFRKIMSRKLLSIISFICIICLILGFLFISVLSIDNKLLITSSVTSFFDEIYNKKIMYNDILIKSLSSNLLLNIFIWLLGISIIGIPIVIFILGIKVFVCSFTFTSIIYTYRFNGIVKAIIYIFPHLINLFLMFVLVYYSVSFSITLFNYLFRKKDCNRSEFVKRYIILLIVSCLLLVFSSLIETFLIPFLLNLIKL